MREDSSVLCQRSDDLQMKFNIEKCTIKHNKVKNVQAKYAIDGKNNGHFCRGDAGSMEQNSSRVHKERAHCIE